MSEPKPPSPAEAEVLAALARAKTQGFDAVTYAWLQRETQRPASTVREAIRALKRAGRVKASAPGRGRGAKAVVEVPE